ncbi:hypothetical protein R3W88_014496 [Solanum pinnatisectum]|uniref:Uncharacterized protein n=1 Tax=Solanum pinnatisectum TaxID=50273 RepID=A0AAV9KT84_9SOLN|nr:hypothetical protein R3W88_014496 [Solanum pinnatisectum]
MSQASQTSNAKKSYNCHCGNPATLRTSHTDTNPASSLSNFQGVAKFEILKKLRESKENRNLLMTFLKEAEEQMNNFKVLLKDDEIDRDQLKERLILTEQKEKRLKTILCGLFLVFAFWKCVTGM